MSRRLQGAGFRPITLLRLMLGLSVQDPQMQPVQMKRPVIVNAGVPSWERDLVSRMSNGTVLVNAYAHNGTRLRTIRVPRCDARDTALAQEKRARRARKRARDEKVGTFGKNLTKDQRDRFHELFTREQRRRHVVEDHRAVLSAVYL